ncbi:hypothetical protein C8R42DRAFT_720997 [Lentinula raphanica]|nr:hypothetical protein C8R42DRAFT_720997 [Lentinula raphanica]
MAISDIFCCFRTSSSDDSTQGVIDERTHLIPTTSTEDQVEPTPNLVFIDPVQFRDRLGTIVRAKESRMVNVTPHYRSREQSLTRNPGFRASSRMSSAMNSARTSTPRSMSSSDDESTQSPVLAIDPEAEEDEEDTPRVVVSSPGGTRPIQQKPFVPDFDDPSLKLSVSWGD